MLAAIRAITDARPTYGYHRVTALLNRARRSSGEPPLNHKRIFRLTVTVVWDPPCGAGF